jgi:hypothetical protein
MRGAHVALGSSVQGGEDSVAVRHDGAPAQAARGGRAVRDQQDWASCVWAAVADGRECWLEGFARRDQESQGPALAVLKERGGVVGCGGKEVWPLQDVLDRVADQGVAGRAGPIDAVDEAERTACGQAWYPEATMLQRVQGTLQSLGMAQGS